MNHYKDPYAPTGTTECEHCLFSVTSWILGTTKHWEFYDCPQKGTLEMPFFRKSELWKSMEFFVQVLKVLILS